MSLHPEVRVAQFGAQARAPDRQREANFGEREVCGVAHRFVAHGQACLAFTEQRNGLLRAGQRQVWLDGEILARIDLAALNAFLHVEQFFIEGRQYGRGHAR